MKKVSLSILAVAFAATSLIAGVPVKTAKAKAKQATCTSCPKGTKCTRAVCAKGASCCE